MRAIHHIQTASDELTKLHSEVLRLEQRLQAVHRIFLNAVEAIRFERQRAPRLSVAAATPHHRLMGQPLKVNPEFSVRVQQALELETKKEAEIVVGAVVDALEHCLLRNLESDGFSMKLGGFGKFKVRHLKPTRRRIGFSGETVTTRAKRKVKFVPLGKLRASEKVG